MDENILEFVDPLIGTDYHGHTFPGATLPFGMVQLSPDTRTDGWDACGGYHYSDSSILGFSHTHLSGTGIGDYGDILFMPFAGNVTLDAGPAEDPDQGYRSRFDHESEEASPGYFAVTLDDYDIRAELSATLRTGIHRYTYPEAAEAGVLIDLGHTIHGHKNPLHELSVVGDHEIRGMKYTIGWARTHKVYFVARFSKPFSAELYQGGSLLSGVGEASGEDLKALLKFSTSDGEQVLASVGISATGYEGALKNLEAEQPAHDFEGVRSAAENHWLSELSKITLEGDDLARKRTFYTALYHSYIFPGIFSDVDGGYLGMDLELHQADDPNYTVFSLWDTHRALHPLLTITRPGLNQAFIRALLQKYKEGGILPMWGLASNYTGTMIGSHAVSVIADAYMKGQRDFDVELALEAMVHSLRWDTVTPIPGYDRSDPWKNLMPPAKYLEQRYGFIPCDLENASVAKGLEFAYNYWAISEMAADLGKDELAREFAEKAERYRIYYDAGTGFMRGKRLDGSWDEPFHPRHSAHWGSPYVEGNAWQWTWYVPHDVEGLISLMGGEEAFSTKLDSLFMASTDVLGEEASADITGLIGQYAHGNEPSHHIAYLYNYIERPWRTQEVLEQILSEHYNDQPDGLCGNEDCGQMSAWYVLNAMGFYPVCPGDPHYSIGKPFFPAISLNLAGDRKFKIIAENFSAEHPYVQEVYLNGEKLGEPFISHAEIEAGGKLRFVMGTEKKVFWEQ